MIERAVGTDGLAISLDEASAKLVGPAFWVLSGRDAAQLKPRRLAEDFLAELSVTS